MPYHYIDDNWNNYINRILLGPEDDLNFWEKQIRKNHYELINKWKNENIFSKYMQ